MAESSKIKVCVRVRPFNRREHSTQSTSKKCIVRMYKNATILTNPSTMELPEDRQQRQVFTFDHSFWSVENSGEGGKGGKGGEGENVGEETSNNPSAYISQKDIYDHIGTNVLKNIFNGYNGCIMAYGQSGSGKTHTMMGGTSLEDMGLIPRLCMELFERIRLVKNFQFQVELSYMEIYAEQIRDLINPQNTKNLRIREHPETGPYVEGLTSIPVEDYYSVNQFIMYGNKHRVTASTQLNDRSSRSHAIFVLGITQLDPRKMSSEDSSDPRKMSSEDSSDPTIQEPLMRSKLCLVDLAGSERVKDSGVTGIHLQEAANINTSLTTLGRVINILAKVDLRGPRGDILSDPTTLRTNLAKESSTPFVPFRDSTLTWLLKDTLGGNSKTVMIATISPSHINYDETLGTLQYAYRAKQIVNKVSVNAGKNEVMLVKLRSELESLEERWRAIRNTKFEEVKMVPMDDSNLKSVTSSWQQYVDRSLELQSKTMASYQQHMGTVLSDLQMPFLFFCGSTEVDRELIRSIKLGRTFGVDIHPRLFCDFVHDDEGVWIVPQGAIVMVNGTPITDPQLLNHGDKLTTLDAEVIYKFKIPICAIKG